MSDTNDIFVGIFVIVAMILLWLFGIAITIAFWGAIIYFAAWTLKHFGAF